MPLEFIPFPPATTPYYLTPKHSLARPFCLQSETKLYHIRDGYQTVTKMPSFARSLFLATPALLLVLISSLPITPTYAVASPFPTSIPLESTGYSVHSIHNASSSKTKVTQSSDHTSKKHSAADHLASMHTTTSNQSNGLKYMRRLLGRRSDADRMSNQMHQLRHHVDSMNASARSMSMVI